MQSVVKSAITLLLMVMGFSAAAHPAPLPHYGASIAQAMINGDKVCASPPANFQPLSASPAAIAYYGLPKRPSGNIAQWLFLVQHAKHRFCTSFTIPQPNHAPQQPLQPLSSTVVAASNWSGFVDLDTTNGGPRFLQATGTFTLDCTQFLYSTGDHAEWVGLGGAVSKYLWQAGWDDRSRSFFDQSICNAE
jgi:hypothetical protein